MATATSAASATPYSDPAMGAKMGELMGGNHAWLFGRRSYEDLLASWNAQGGPFKDALNNTHKYIASRDAGAVLNWPNSTLLRGDDVQTAVADLKDRSDANLVMMGSGVLIKSLMAADLIDQYLLIVAPIVLGTGRRLFCGGLPSCAGANATSRRRAPARVLLTYEPAR